MSETMSFESDQHFLDVFNQLNSMRLKEKLCDIELICGEQHFWAHKIILFASSDYFHRLLTKNHQNVQIKLDWMNPNTLQLVLQFVYTAHITINDENIQDLLAVSDYFQLNNLMKECNAFLKNTLKLDNFVKYSQFVTDLKNNQQFFNILKGFFKQNLEDLYKDHKRDCLISLNYECFQVFLSVDCNRQTQTICQLLVDWLRYDFNVRVNYFPKLFDYVDIDLFQYDFLKKQLTNDFDLINFDQLRYTMSLLKQRVMKNMEMKQIDMKKWIMVIGGESNGEASETVYVYDIDNKNIVAVFFQYGLKKIEATACVSNNELFVIGGKTNNKYLSSVDKYDPELRKWFNCKSMSCPRSRLRAILANDFIYTFGGCIDNELKKTVEMYNIKKDKWFELPAMPVGRCDFAIVAIDSSTLVLLGGDSSIENYRLVHTFNIDTKEWTEHPKLSENLIEPHAAVINGVIYVFDAWTGKLFTYDFDKNRLTGQRCLTSSRSLCSVIELYGKLFVFGGKNNRRGFEMYEPYFDQWTNIQLDTNIDFINHCSTTINPFFIQ